MAVYKRGRGFELRTTAEPIQLLKHLGLGPEASKLQVQRSKPLGHATSICFMHQSDTVKTPFIQIINIFTNCLELV